MDYDVGTFSSQAYSCGAADAFGGAGYERHAALERRFVLIC
jgi:hypothetical protein